MEAARSETPANLLDYTVLIPKDRPLNFHRCEKFTSNENNSELITFSLRFDCTDAVLDKQTDSIISKWRGERGQGWYSAD
jgi:hypothetical protein